MNSVQAVTTSMSDAGERSDAPLDGVARDLGSVLFSMSSRLTRLQRSASIEEPLDEIDDMLTQAILLARLLSMRLHATPRQHQAARSESDGSAVRIELCAGDPDDGRLGLLLRQIVTVFGADIEVQPSGQGSAVIVRIKPAC